MLPKLQHALKMWYDSITIFNHPTEHSMQVIQNSTPSISQSTMAVFYLLFYAEW